MSADGKLRSDICGRSPSAPTRSFYTITAASRSGGDGERGGLLPGLFSRADIVMFPVDCVSHASMSLVKRLCRQTGKPFLPLRSAALAPFCAALAKLDLDREAPMRALPPTE